MIIGKKWELFFLEKDIELSYICVCNYNIKIIYLYNVYLRGSVDSNFWGW